MYINIHSHKNIIQQDTVVFLDGREFIGLHPWNINIDRIEEDWINTEKLILELRPILIGETGLDRHFLKLDISVQELILNKHLNLAHKMNTPIVLHCVHAHSDLLKILKQNISKQLTYLIHDFSAGTTELKQYLKYKVYFSFGKSIFNRSSKSYRSFLEAPKERVFFETDDAEIKIEEIYLEAQKIRPEINWEIQIEQNILKFFNQPDNISPTDFIKNIGHSI